MTDHASSVRIAIIICSVGRPQTLAELVPHLTAQTRPADRVLFVVTKSADVPDNLVELFGDHLTPEILISEKGLTRQRNAGLDAVAEDCDLVIFYDDDFVPSKYSLDGLAAAFARWPDVSGMTGDLLADGINGPGLEDAEARKLVAEFDGGTLPEARILHSGLEGLYGCNMAYRMADVGEIRFDPALPLYGWQEDIDFAARLPGDRIKTTAFTGVHRGAKSGRETTGARLGYSQLANPWYLWRKGSMSGRFALRLAARNFAANHVKMLNPEPWTDRKGRAKGNWLALKDIVIGRAHPERILNM